MTDESGGEHSTRSDRVTNIGYRLSSGASPLPAANIHLTKQNAEINVTKRFLKC